MIEKTYTLPLIGKVNQRDGFEGDESNPLRPPGIDELLDEFSLVHGDIAWTLTKSYDIGKGKITVVIMATEEAHTAMTKTQSGWAAIKSRRGWALDKTLK